MQEKEFWRAVKGGDVEQVRQGLGEAPAWVSLRDKEQCTPLHWAAWKGHVQVVHLLLDAGADISAHNENDHWGTTALHAAAHGNRGEVAEALIARGADVNQVKAGGQGTPLQETKIHQATAAVWVLRAAGARE